MDGDLPGKDEDFALQVAEESHAWYRKHAVRTRRLYRFSEVSLLVASAAIPLSVAVFPDETFLPAILGAVVAVLAGARSVFHWHENWARFSEARKAVERECRRYRLSAAPYDDASTRGQLLVDAVSNIEQEELRGWLSVISNKPQDDPAMNGLPRTGAADRS